VQRLRKLWPHVRALGEAVPRHALGTHAAAISFHLLVSLVPLALLGVAVLGRLGLQDVWTDSVGPALQERLSSPVYVAADYEVGEIFGSSSVGLMVFAALLLVWFLARAVASTMAALNDIHEVGEDPRSFREKAATAVWLAAAVGLCVVGALLAVSVVPRLADGALHWLALLLALAAGGALLGVAVTLLVRYAPAERPKARRASAGAAFVVVAWLLESLAFGWWSGSVANYRTATGNLAVFLVLTAYVIVAVGIFLAGVELDEAARRGSTRSSARPGRRRRARSRSR
jgi:YihY family inner membrane protein